MSDGGRDRSVCNVHFYAKGVACGERGRVRPEHDRRGFVLARPVTESGHSAVQVLVHDAENRHDLERLLVIVWTTDDR